MRVRRYSIDSGFFALILYSSDRLYEAWQVPEVSLSF